MLPEIRSNIINAAIHQRSDVCLRSGNYRRLDYRCNHVSNSHILLDSGNKRVVVYGASSGATSGKRVQIYYNSDTDFGFYATDAAGNCLARFGSANQIAGWNIDANRIYKNNIALGADGSIMNGSKWKLNNDGSGSIASGNISWDAAGAVTFSAAVSLNWKNDIEAANVPTSVIHIITKSSFTVKRINTILSFSRAETRPSNGIFLSDVHIVSKPLTVGTIQLIKVDLSYC